MNTIKEEKISISELESWLFEGANLLRGIIDAADFKTYIFPLLFYKRIYDVFDEEFQISLKEADGANISRGVARLSCSNSCNNQYLNHALKVSNIISQVIGVSQGSTFREISLTELKKIKVPLPPLTEQKQIAAILTQIDETIAAARGTIESTKALKMKLFNELLSLKVNSNG